MMRLLQKVRYNLVNQPLRWREYMGNVQFLIYNPQSEGSIIYMIDESVTFPELQQRDIFKEVEFKLPKEIDLSTPVATLLTKYDKPIEIEVATKEETIFIKNRIAQYDQQMLIKCLASPNNIYHLTNDQLSMNDNRKIVTGFYLRLQVSSLLKEKGLDKKSKLNDELIGEIMAYLGSLNQVSEQSTIFKLTEAKEKVGMRMNYTQNLIDKMLDEADRLLNLYRAGVIGLTAVHLGGFGYAIFGVEWLGWDIIEPLTFSVGTLYSLLGLRFYRKFRKDRTQESIREALQNWVLKPSKRIELNNLKVRLQQQRAEMEDVEQKLKLAHHRLIPLSTLPDDM